MFFGRRSPRRNEELVLAAQREQANQAKMRPRVSAGAAGALTAPPAAEFELAQLPDGDVNVKILIDQIILVAQNNNDKSKLLSQIVDQMLQDFKKNIDTLEQSKTEADKKTELAVLATNQLRDEKSRLEADKQAEIATLSEKLQKNVADLAREQENMRSKTMEYTTEVASLNAACDRLTGVCSNKDKVLLESAQQITRLEGELTDLNAVGLQKDEEVNRIKKERDQAVQQHTATIDQLRDELAGATVDSAAKQEQLKAAQAAAEDLKKRLTEVGAARNASTEENSRIRSENEQLLGQIREKDANVAELERSAAAAKLAAENAQKEVGKEKAKCNQMAAEINRLNKALDTMKDSGAKLGNIGNIIDQNANASDVTKDLLKRMEELNKRVAGASVGGRKKTRKKKNKKKRNSTKRIVFKTKKQNKKSQIKKVKKMNRKPAKKLTRRRK